MSLHPRISTTRAVFYHRVRRHGNNRDCGPLGLLPNRTGSRQAVHHGHLEIHQNRVVGRATAQARERLGAIIGDLDHHARGLQQLTGNLLIDDVVLGEQHPNPRELCGVHRFLSTQKLGARALANNDSPKRVRQRHHAGRFLYEGHHPFRFRSDLRFLLSEAGQQDDLRARRAGVGIECSNGVDTAQSWKCAVEQRQVERLRERPADLGRRCVGRCHRRDVQRESRELLHEHRARVVVVLDQ